MRFKSWRFGIFLLGFLGVAVIFFLHLNPMGRPRL
jgi:hypothetical protein